MISKSDQLKFKEILGHQYAREVLEMLNAKEIKNRFGKPHSLTYIRMVFQGYRHNPDIERAIIELAILRKKEKEDICLHKSNLFD